MTRDEDWKRFLVGAGLSAGGAGGSLDLAASFGRAYNAPIFEMFTVGGVQAPFFDQSVLQQRIAAPGLPVGALVGPRAATWRVSLGGGLVEPYLMGFAAGDQLPRLRDVYDRFYKI